MRKLIVVLTAAFILESGFFTASNAQVKQVRIKVNGLACPFCAYGLEKKLKKLDGVEKVTISLNKGLATLDNKADQSIDFENLKTLVKAAGFSATEIAVTVQGVIQESDGRLILFVTGSDDKFILERDETLTRLLSLLGGNRESVQVKGTIRQNANSGQVFTMHIKEYGMK